MLLYAVPIVVVILLILLITVRTVTVYEYERGLRYDAGRFTGVLEPGAYRILARRTVIRKVDVRPVHVAVPGQEVICSDGVALKITVSARFHVKDPALATHAVASYPNALYTDLQLALRELVAGGTAEELLANRTVLGARLLERTAPKAEAYGLELAEAEVKDLMFPGELKKVFAQVVRAKQEGLAALEKARGESAALRNLANAAALLESRPALMHLRLLQAFGQDSGNTVVLNLSGSDLAPLGTKKPASDSDPA